MIKQKTIFTTNQTSYMKKPLLYLLLLTALCSCNTINNKTSPLVVTGFKSNEDMCEYDLHYGNNGKDHIDVIDSCGKYKIGDTLWIGKRGCN